MGPVWQAVVLFVVCFIGSVIQGTTGFGYALFSMAVLPFFLPLKTAAVVVLLLGFVSSVQIAFNLRKHINVKLLLIPILASFVGRYVGVKALMSFDTGVLKSILGVVLVILSIYFAFFNRKIRIRPLPRNGIMAGLLSGVLGGMFSVSGPPLVIYYYSATDDKMEYNACLQTSFVLGIVVTIFLHILEGNIHMEALTYTGVGLVAVLAGSMVGLWCFKRLDKEILTKAIYTFMAIMGISMIVGR